MPQSWNDNQLWYRRNTKLNKRHRGGKSCCEAKIKRDKDAKRMKDGSLLLFLKLKAIPVPSTVQDAGPVMIHASDPVLASMAFRQPSLSQSHVSVASLHPLKYRKVDMALSKDSKRLLKAYLRIYQSAQETTS